MCSILNANKMLKSWKIILSKCIPIPKRYVFGIMGFLGVLNAYLMRAVLSIAIIEMVQHLNSSGINQEDVCPNPHVELNVSHANAVKTQYLYSWSEEIQGLVLGSFYWGYLVSQYPGGMLAEKFGGKYVTGLGILLTSFFTLLTPVVVKLGDWPWLMVFRILIGLGEGITFPAITVLMSKWIPLAERSTIGTLVASGLPMGNVVGNAFGGLIIGYTNSWESAFYVFGLCGIIWFIFWLFLVYSEPDSHPYISEKEIQYLKNEIKAVSTERKDVPWKAILTSVPLWGLILNNIGFDWGVYAMLNDLPKYMKSVLKFNVQQSGIWSSLPYIVMCIFALTAAQICDKLIDKKIMTISFARKFFITVSSIGAAVLLIAASYAGCDRILTVGCFTFGMGFMGVHACGAKVNVLDLSLNYAGTLTAIVNGIGAVCGIITPYVIGLLTKNQTLSEWRMVFWITFFVFIASAILFVMFGSGDVQWWNEGGCKQDLELKNYNGTTDNLENQKQSV